MKWFRVSVSKKKMKEALDHIKKASWAVNEVNEHLDKATSILEVLGNEVEEEFRYITAASEKFFPEVIDSNLTKVEEKLEERLK